MSPLKFDDVTERPYPYFPELLNHADAYFERVMEETSWSVTGDIYMKNGGCGWINQAHLPKRQSAWSGPVIRDGRSTARRCFAVIPTPWTPAVLEIKQRVEEFLKEPFNSCGLQLYRDHDCGIAKHRDQDDECDWTHPIASISLGAARLFNVYDSKDKLTSSEYLWDGSLCVMPAGFQETHQHEIPKEQYPCGPRINLTFRWIDLKKSIPQSKPEKEKMKTKYKPHDDAYKPPQKTIGGYNGYHVTSALQKCIRRGLEEDALFWAAELWMSCNQMGREYVWHRLRVIASEDVGLADNNACVQVSALYANFQRRPNEKLFLWHAVLLLARAPKSRIVDHAGIVVVEGDRGGKTIPDFALDNHAGGEMNWSESFRLENCTLEDVYEKQARKLREDKS